MEDCRVRWLRDAGFFVVGDFLEGGADVLEYVQSGVLLGRRLGRWTHFLQLEEGLQGRVHPRYEGIG